MEAFRQGKHLLRCIRWTTTEIRSSARVNRWKINSRCLAAQAGTGDVKQAVEKVDTPVNEEDMLKEKWERERAEANKFKIGDYVVPTNWEKMLLVYAGAYRSTQEVPELITSYEIMKVKDKIRAKLAVFLTVLSAFGAYLIAKFSRREYDHIWDTEAATVKPDFDKKKPLS